MAQEYGIHIRGGVITERDADYCTVRVRVPAGNLSAEQLRGIASVAKKFGRGYIHLTARQTLEIPHLHPAKLPIISRHLAKNGTPLGSERDEVVNITACPGIERCKYANIDTIALANKLDSNLFGKEMPVKMRIAISGCPNACTSPMLNEVGIVGRIQPLRIPGLCTGCGTCVKYCKENAITIKNGVSILDPAKCVQCGVCIQSCPFGLLKSKHKHYLLTIGGRRGRHPQIGKTMVVVEDEGQVVKIIEKIISWVYRRAWSGRLLSEQLDDLHFDEFRKEIVAEFTDDTAVQTPH